MPEAYEQEALLKQMLDEVPPHLDKREGSVIYHTLGPVSVALAQQSYMLAYMTELLYMDTASGEWLDKAASQLGVEREPATHALRQINVYDNEDAPLSVPLGSQFAVDSLSFAVTQEIAPGQYQATCKQAGVQGNAYSGAVLPVDHISGLGRADLLSPALIPARDEETDEELRTRTYNTLRRAPYGGNIADYEQKVLSIPGVGAVRIFRASEMELPGHVGILIGDENGETATQTLIDSVAEVMGEDGSGLAPIGHTPIIATSVPLDIDVVVPLVLAQGASLAVAKPAVEQAIIKCIKSVEFTASTVFWARLVSDILSAHESVVDVGSVTINGASENLTLSKTFENYQVPVVGTITISEV